MKNVITRAYQDEKRIIYKRCWREPGLNIYFEFDKKTEQATGKEFKSNTQYRAYLKTV